jgi:hypothetical protein
MNLRSLEDVRDAAAPCAWHPPSRVLGIRLNDQLRLGSRTEGAVFWRPKKTFRRRGSLRWRIGCLTCSAAYSVINGAGEVPGARGALGLRWVVPNDQR